MVGLKSSVFWLVTTLTGANICLLWTLVNGEAGSSNVYYHPNAGSGFDGMHASLTTSCNRYASSQNQLLVRRVFQFLRKVLVVVGNKLDGITDRAPRLTDVPFAWISLVRAVLAM